MIRTESKSVTYNKEIISGNYDNSILLSDINFIQRRNLLNAVRQKNKTNKYFSIKDLQPSFSNMK